MSNTTSYQDSCQSSKKKNIIIITGATGSGKSSIAIDLAKKNNGIIINADSMQIYKQIPIITAQPDEKDLSQVKHLLYGFVDIFDTKNIYSVGKYLSDLQQTIQDIEVNEPDKIPIIVGGTMLYIDAILHGLSEMPTISEDIKKEIRNKYKKKTANEIFEDLKKIDKEYAKIVDKNNPQRLIRGIEVKLSTGMSITEFWKKNKQQSLFKDYNIKKIIVDLPREKLYERINNRFDIMLKNGALKEAKKIYDQCNLQGFKHQDIPKAIGLHEFFDYFDGKISLETAIDKAKQLSRNYAKRQLTWHRHHYKDFEITTSIID